MNSPVLDLYEFQREVFTSKLRIVFALWRRQAGKSHLISAKAIERMLSVKNHSCFVVSASIATGQEIVLKEAHIWHNALSALAAQMRELEEAGASGKFRLGGALLDKGNKKLLSPEDMADLFEHNKGEVRIYHSNTLYSRTRILAPNPNTARGFTGDVFGDEIGFWECFREVFDAVEPIMSRNPQFIMWLFTTPPEDDKHFTYDLLNPGLIEFEPNARGNWYDLQSGYKCHRLDAEDAALAGLPLYDPQDGRAVSFGEYRTKSLDRAAADRNYMLKFMQGGSAAVPRAWIYNAMHQGKATCSGFDLTLDPSIL